MRLPAAGLACILSLCLLAAVAGASHQTAKTGCTSRAVPAGFLFTPSFTVPAATSVNLTFVYWFEIESVSPAQDTIGVDISVNGGDWQPLQNFTPNPPSGATDDRPVSSGGFQQPPIWLAANATLYPGVVPAGGSARLRFKFQGGDMLRQGFRGFAVDDVRVFASGPGTSPLPLETFEGGTLPAGWEASGLWHVQPDPQNIGVIPGINPELVTLPDAGFLPADDQSANRHVAWFGEAATGTYCGTDALAAISLAPVTASRFLDETHTVTASTAHAPAGTQVRWSVTGPNPASGSSAVDPATGQTAFSWTGPNAGQDTLTAFLDLSGDGIQQPDEPGSTATVDWRARTVNDLPDPMPFTDVNVQPVSGEVYVKPPGAAARASQAGAPAGFVPLKQAGKLPVGTQIDTTNGRVLVESAASQTVGAVQRAQFFFGRFTVLQRRATRPITDIVLKGGTFRGCPRAKGADADTSQRRRSRRSRVRRVWGDGSGRFRTRGRYSAATVRGTKWVVEDRCDGTLTRVARLPRSSRVVVRDYVRRRTVTVRAGRSYLAAKR